MLPITLFLQRPLSAIVVLCFCQQSITKSLCLPVQSNVFQMQLIPQHGPRAVHCPASVTGENYKVAQSNPGIYSGRAATWGVCSCSCTDMDCAKDSHVNPKSILISQPWLLLTNTELVILCRWANATDIILELLLMNKHQCLYNASIIVIKKVI